MKVLLVDDEILALQGEKQALLKMGYSDVLEAECAADALTLLEDEKPDVIVADISMPDMDGLEMLRRIRAESRDTIVIFLSGYDRFEYAQRAVELSAFAYLLKPVAARELKKVLDSAAQVIAQRREAREQVSALRRRLEKELADQGQNLLQELLLDGSANGGAIQRRVEERGIDLPRQGCIVRLQEVGAEGLPSGRGDIGDMVGNELNAKGLRTWKCWVEKGVCLLVEHSKGSVSQMELYRYVSDAVRRVGVETGARLLFGVGGIYTLADCRVSLREAESILRQTQEGGSVVQIADTQIEYFVRSLLDGVPHRVDRGIEYILSPVDTATESGRNSCRNLCMYLAMLSYVTCHKAPREAEWYKQLKAVTDRDEAIRWTQEICRGCAEADNGAGSGETDPLFLKAQEYVRLHFAEHITLGSAAAHCHYTESYFSRAFTRAAGCGFIKYLSAYRVDQARLMLLGTQWRLQTIAQKTGFTSAKYFSEVFSQMTGMQPSVYRGAYRFG